MSEENYFEEERSRPVLLPIRDRTQFAVLSLIIAAATNFLFNVMDYRVMASLENDIPVTMEDLALAKAGDSLWMLSFIFYFIASVTSAVAVCMWFYRANQNLHRYGLIMIDYTPGWAVGWFFIPIASFVLPFMVLREIWRGTLGIVNDERSQWKFYENDWRVLAWWLFHWLPTIFGFMISFKMPSEEAEQIVFQVENAWHSLAIGALIFIPAFLLSAVMRDISSRQEQLRN